VENRGRSNGRNGALFDQINRHHHPDLLSGRRRCRDQHPDPRKHAGDGCRNSRTGVKNPVANRESKHDRLAVASLALASLEPQQSASANESLRQAYAASSAADIEAAKAVAALPQVVPQPAAPKAKAAAIKPQPQKSYAL